MLGAVGALQFVVVKFRLEDEYSVQARYETISWLGVRWPRFPDEITEADFISNYNSFHVRPRRPRVLCSPDRVGPQARPGKEFEGRVL